MSRRTLTLLLSSALLVVLALFAGTQAVPYVALAPGPTFNTLGATNGTEVIKISGRPTFPDTGHLNLTTISVVTRLTFVQAVRGWFEHDLAVVPRDVIYPPDKTDEQVRAEDKVAMTESQDSATTAAFRQLGIPGTTTVVVGKVEATAPANGKLKTGDVLTGVDGTAVSDGAQLRALIGTRKPGQDVRIAFRRAGKDATTTITTAAAKQDDGTVRPVIGVLTSEQTSYPVKVEISLKDVGGPSAGLMFSLGIIDKLTPGSLTDGRFIAGTGTIDPAGNVGPIGGIQQKLIGARSKGATTFLVPQANCAAAVDNPPAGLTLIKVTTLKDALGQLTALRAGKTTTPCSR